jgi:filamentous hemagglutinin family protein
MNRAFRLVWSRRLASYVVAGENARARGKSGGRAVCAAVLMAAIAFGDPAQAAGTVVLPTGGKVTAGSAVISTSGNTMTVQENSQNAAIDWQGFSIGSNAQVDFVQPGASSVILNRVVGGAQSLIDGALNANGQVFLLNSSGVLIGKGASIDAQGFLASTLNISDAGFVAGQRTLSGVSNAGILNLGTIRANAGGYVALLGSQVVNEGVIRARLGTVALAAGDRVSLDFNGDSLLGVAVERGALGALVANREAILADGGEVILTARGLDSVLAASVNNTGLIQARTVGNTAGHIYLLGDMQSATVDVGGTLDASAPGGGNGGSIETSGAQVRVADGTLVTTAAPRGITGSWLVDPVDFTIAPGGGDISGATLSSELATTNVSLSSTQGAQGTQGNLNVNDTVNWSSHTLTLTAVNNVNINAVMTASGSAGLDLEPVSGQVNVALGSNGFTGRVDFSGSGTLTIDSHVYTVINALGSGYTDTSAGTLQGMQGNLGGYYALGSNIDATPTSSWNGGAGFAPVGQGCQSCTPFSGVFNGLGHTINGLTINQNISFAGSNGFLGDIGLFGVVNGSGAISNVGLTNASITVDGSTAAVASIATLVGVMQGAITNSYATGSVSVTTGLNNLNLEGQIGGLVGYLFGDNVSDFGSVTNSHASVNVSAPGFQYVGGLVGNTQTGVGVYDSYATGSVAGTQYVGGLTGGLGNGYPSATIARSYATGNVSGSSYVGGLVGTSTNGGLITACFATGSVTASGAWSGNRAVGGLVGSMEYASIDTSYATGAVHLSGAVSGNTYAGGLVGWNYGPSTLKTSYFSGAVVNAGSSAGTTNVGGLLGFNYVGYTGGKMVTTASFFNSSLNGGLLGVGGVGASQAGITGLTSAQMTSASSFQPAGSAAGQWDFANTWFIYPGQTAPLLRSFLTPLTVSANSGTLAYDGSAQNDGVAYSIVPDPSQILGTLVFSGAGTTAGSYTVTPGGLYSGQLGYLITFASGTVTITGGPSGPPTNSGGQGGTGGQPPASIEGELLASAVADALLEAPATAPESTGTGPGGAPAPQIPKDGIGPFAAVFGAGTPLAFAAAPDDAAPPQVVTLSQAKQLLQGATPAAQTAAGADGDGRSSSDDQSRDVRVPVSPNSLAEIVNGGVKLPSGVEQQLFVVPSK